MRFKLVNQEVTRTVKSRFFGIFTQTATANELSILPSEEAVEFVKNKQNRAYPCAFGSFDLHSIAKAFASDVDSRFKIVGFFLLKSGEAFDSAVFVKANTLSEISVLWENLVSKEMTAEYRMIRSIVLKDSMTGERILLNAFFDMDIEFKDTADSSVVETFNKEFLDIATNLFINEVSLDELDQLFKKVLKKSRNQRAQEK